MYYVTVGVVEQIAATHKYWHDGRYTAGFDQSWARVGSTKSLSYPYLLDTEFKLSRGRGANQRTCVQWIKQDDHPFTMSILGSTKILPRIRHYR